MIRTLADLFSGRAASGGCRVANTFEASEELVGWMPIFVSHHVFLQQGSYDSATTATCYFRSLPFRVPIDDDGSCDDDDDSSVVDLARRLLLRPPGSAAKTTNIITTMRLPGAAFVLGPLWVRLLWAWPCAMGTTEMGIINLGLNANAEKE